MFTLRNGSLPANALLIAIGAAAGVGMTMLVAPISQNHQGNTPNSRSSARKTSWSLGSLSRKAGAHSKADSAPASVPSDDPQEHAAALRDAGAEAARNDTATALLMAADFTSERDKLDFLRGIYSVWAAADPVSALEYAKSSLPAGLARSETIGIAVNKWASQDPRAAWIWSEANLTGPAQEQALTDVLIGWTRRAPADASQWLASTGYSSQPLFTAVARTWAEQDLKKADAWASTLPQTLQKSAKPIIATEWASQDPIKAAQHFATEIAQPDGAQIAVAIADIWGTTDPATTSGWIDQMPPGPGKDEAAATLAIVWAASDIKAAVAWSNSLHDGSMRRQVITHIGTTWGAIDPDSALEWLDTLPAPLATDAIAGAFNSWAATDAIGLKEAIDTSPASPQMDQARLALADVLSATDVSSSMDLAVSLASSPGRDEAAARYFRLWLKTDDLSAQDWLTQNWSSLDPSTQQRLAREQQRPVVAR